MSPQKSREAMVAGSFYPAHPAELTSMINQYLMQAEIITDPDRPICGLVAPHAGYVFSGPVAAWGYKQLQGRRYDTVVVISPSHFEAFYGCSIFSGTSYKTPLGEIPVDTRLAEKIASGSRFVKISDQGHSMVRWNQGEHALEVQLPFLQRVLKEPFFLIPVVMGNQITEIIEDLAESLAGALQDKQFLIVASSDLSHYHSYGKAKQMDHVIYNLFQENKIEQLENGFISDKLEACGGGPIVSMLKALNRLGKIEPKSVNIATSGDVPYGEKDRVVGYMSGIVYLDKGEQKPQNYSWSPDEQEQRLLFQIARKSILSNLEHKPFSFPKNIPDTLKPNMGAFVTLKIEGNLRGCIGYTIGIKPLYETVQEMALAAAFEDPRFPPLTRKEFDLIDIEISILTPMEKVTNLKDIEVGKHGLMIKKGYYSGLLLPQVATEYGWTREEFLRHTCQKAGLPSDAYKDKSTEILSFSAIVIHEK